MTSPISQFNYVIIPRDYLLNSLRSERDCLRTGYEIRKSLVFAFHSLRIARLAVEELEKRDAPKKDE